MPKKGSCAPGVGNWNGLWGMGANKPDEPSPDTIAALSDILGPFNKAGMELKPETRFSEDLNFDSLVVMEFIAAIEDHFDISMPLNILPDIATINELAVAVEKIVSDETA
jgi:acyl carrier protein